MSTVRLIPLILAACAGEAVADATLTYELTGPDGASTTKTLSIARFFARIDDSAKEDSFLIYQAGKFFPLYVVYPADKAYTRLTPEVKATLGPDSRSARPEAPAEATSPTAAEEATPVGEEPSAKVKPSASPASDAGEKLAAAGKQTDATASGYAPEGAKPEGPVSAVEPASGEETARSAEKPPEPLPAKPELRASREKREIAGVECRVVDELRDGKPVLQHCMANKARLGITEREVRTLARTFVMARERDLGWLGAATEDEEFVSIETRDPATGAHLVLKKVSTAPLPQGHLKIPRDYEQRNP